MNNESNENNFTNRNPSYAVLLCSCGTQHNKNSSTG